MDPYKYISTKLQFLISETTLLSNGHLDTSSGVVLNKVTVFHILKERQEDRARKEAERLTLEYEKNAGTEERTLQVDDLRKQQFVAAYLKEQNEEWCRIRPRREDQMNLSRVEPTGKGEATCRMVPTG